MIRKVKFSNFYSFRQEQEISFLAKKKQDSSYFDSLSGDKISKIAAFIGGNASGKTNIMRLFSFLSYFVCRSGNDEEVVREIPYKTFFFNDGASAFFIEFERDDTIFYYELEIKSNAIVKEALSLKKIEKYSRKEEVFSRGKDSLVLNPKYFPNIEADSIPSRRADISFVAFIKKWIVKVDIIDLVYDFFAGFKSNVNEKGEINNLFHRLSSFSAYLRDRELKKKMEDFIRRFDIGLEGFAITEQEGKVGPVSVAGIHSTLEPNKEIDLQYESRGTQSLFFVLDKILSALKNDNVIILDEIESGFHPEALSKLISYFLDEDKERKAQLIFSSHSLEFMNKLDMHQIFLSQKHKNGDSSIIRLNEVEGIRSDENFLAKYMTGAYGGFPNIRI